MRFSQCSLFSALAAPLVSAAALPLANKDTTNDLVERAVSDDDTSSADTVSSVPLEAFGNFHTLSLDQVISDETALQPATEVDPPGNSLLAAIAQDDSTTTSTCSFNRTRIEWRKYSDSDRRAFVDSIACLTKLPSAGAAYAPSTSRFEDFAQTHQKMTSQVHSSGVFLPWHRYFTWLFEQALRNECGFETGRAMPWWDETLDSGAFHNSSLFTNDYFGSLPGPTNGSGTCIVDGAFANLTCHIGPGTNNVDHCLSRAVDETMTAQSSTAYIDYCAQQTVYGSFESCVETGPHAWAHNGVGSIMSDVYASPSDPIFYMHHLFVDHQWASWQEGNATRLETVPGACASNSDPCVETLTTSTVLNMNGLGEDKTVGDVINTHGNTLCYSYDIYY